ncbi:MAG: sigma 54-interacting transcriptional regulator [Deltaproteobacteria bacterium]|nr:sigma 54-interacting transcriptional regulator [Deltaproteobacteria bacterium]
MVKKINKGGTKKTAELSDEALARIRTRAKNDQVSLLVFSLDGARVVPLSEGQILVIGRSASADVTVRDNSLSNQHASIELSNGEVWVEDLQSTNGTRVAGEKIDRAKAEAGTEIAFGAVTASIHLLTPAQGRQLGLESHDRFQAELEMEVGRARLFGRAVALLMIRAEKGKRHSLADWLPGLKQRLRPFDRMALYSQNTVEILLPEASIDQASELCSKNRKDGHALVCGLGSFPKHASSAGELLEVTRTALEQTSAGEALYCAQLLVSSDREPEFASRGLEPVIRSAAIKAVYKTAKKVASSAIPVLIQGETGTGKEIVARVIHTQGKRQKKPFICINCGSIPVQLVESTLFGHEKGAFTGADHRSPGVFESANGGTVLLDEVGELPPPAQASLLRVLETKRFTRVGSSKEIEVDVRILAATHRDLEAMCRSGEFREDLFYRLNGMTIDVPPLRERTDEIEALSEHFIQQANKANDCSVRGIDDEARQLLLRYHWPGNVRELRNAIERAVVISNGRVISVDDLPEPVRGLAKTEHYQDPESGADDQDFEVNLRAETQRLETRLVLKALKKTGGDRAKAAKILGLPVRSLSHKMQVLGIKRPAYDKSD